MGRIEAILFAVVFAHVCASPRIPDESPFARSAIESIPEHEPLPLPIRASVESVPLRSLRDEGDGRLPLRDAVEKRPIPVFDTMSFYKFITENRDADDVETISVIRDYYGAASFMNNDTSYSEERLQQGNANLQEMQQAVSGSFSRRLVVCYMESWSAYRPPPLAFTAGLVPKTCTHLHYAFATMHPHTYAVIPTNEDYDIIKGGYRIATGLKRRIPGLRVIISVGGDGTERLFSEMIQEPYRRNNFVESALSFLQDNDFDGLDLHWVYSGDRDEKEKELLTTFLYELSEKFTPYGYLLSTVLPPFRYQIEDGYDLSAVSGATDYTILQAWDMNHARRDQPPPTALQHSALYRDPGAPPHDQRYDNIEFMVKYVLRHGMAAEKLVLGIPMFGRSYTLAGSIAPKPGAAVSSWGEEGPYTQMKGLLSYFEVCMSEREGRGSTAVDEAGNAYAVFENQWVTYDTPNTVLEKMKFLRTYGLAGAAAWAIDMDDFRGLCGKPFPLLSAISTSLNGEHTLSDQSSLKVGSCEPDSPYLASDEDSCAHFRFCTGGVNYRMLCEDERLYDPSTGFCGHQDVSKCVPGQSLRISVEDAARFLSQAYENDYEMTAGTQKDMRDPERLISAYSYEDRRGKENDKRVVCYMTNWAFYRRGDGKFVPEQIDTRLCTHVVYAYATLSPDELVAKEFDPWADITHNLYERVTSLKDVKVLLGLGGWTDSAGDKYSRLVSSPQARTKFAEKLVTFLKMHNFKGLHLDWNYPVCWQSNCKKGAQSDKINFALLVKEVARALHSADMELGVALSGYKEVIESAYDLPTISEAVDFMSAMTYDYHGGWERTTAHHTPLLPLKKDPLPYYSIEYAVKNLINGGVEPKKLLLGLAFYGQSYRLGDTEGPAGPGSLAVGPGEPGEFTKQPGMLSYYEICYRVKNLRWKTGRQDNAGPYAYSDNQWVGYDDQKSVTEKVEWAVQKGLGGVTAWAIDLDDFSNRCCNEPSPLLRAAGRALGRAVPHPPAVACERPPEPVTPLPPPTSPAESDGSPGGGDHHHEHHTTTTWPSWNPGTTQSTTQSTWWPQPTSPTTTTTARPTTTTRTTTTRATTTTSTTTTRRTTTTSTTQAAPVETELEGASCQAGEYHAAPGDCEGYLQCVGGSWIKHRCAPGLHWSEKTQRCDWPSFAMCKAPATTQRPTTTTTLAPITSRPPQRPTTTTTTPSYPIMSDEMEISEGSACSGGSYEAVAGDCGAYYHCEGDVYRKHRCAPGLHWSAASKHCDWPKYANCQFTTTTSEPTTTSTTTTTTTTTTTPRPTQPPRPTTVKPSVPREGSPCGPRDSHAPATSCDSYMQCVGGVWRKQRCPAGLHWDRRANRCDWVEFAMCEIRNKPLPTTTTRRPYKTTRRTTPARTTTTTTTTTEAPTTTTTRRPAQYQKPMRCVTGTYHPHPRCEKFYVCVNSALVMQSCPPGLVWSRERSQCDFPTAANRANCGDRHGTQHSSLVQPNDEIPAVVCNNGEYAKNPADCSRYLHCLFGKYEEFSCSAGLHWNQEKQICDWPNNANCKTGPTTTTTTEASIYDHVDLDDEMPQPEMPKPAIEFLDVDTRPDLLNSRYKVVCYYTNWAWYRPGFGKYSPEDIDPTLCTHIVYGFAVLGRDGLIEAFDSYADLENRFYERVADYKKYGIKVSLGIGGWKDSAGDKYSVLVNSPQARAKFVRHVVQFIERYGFDGLDLDWEYPKCWQVDCSKGPDSDKEAFADFVRELSAAFRPKGLLLSAAVSPSKQVIDAGYDVPTLARYLDWIAVMTYDYHGQWDRKTGHVAPLYYHPDDDVTYFNANYTIHYWMEKGASPSKLVMGMPLYGQTFSTVKPQAGLNAPATAAGMQGEYTRASGFLAYHEICERIRNRKWVVVQDKYERMGPYAYKGDQWVSFDDVESIKKKVNYIKSLRLGGGMVWALDLDDFNNRCKRGRYPLMNAIKDTFLEGSTDDDDNVISSYPVEPAHNIDESDTQDIEVRPPTTTTVRPTLAPITTQATTEVSFDEPTGHKIVCYYTNWAWYRPDTGKYTPNDIEPELCSHIVYSFAVLDTMRLIIKPHDNWLDVENKFYEKVVALKARGVKVVLGLGGWNDSAGDKYSRLVNNPSARRKFIFHVLDFLEQYGFDGLDLDWEYPKCWQVNCEKGPSSDKEGFAALVKELSRTFKKRGLLLSAAVSASKRVIDLAYDIPVLGENLDWISLMAYDYHGQWDDKTGHVAPMYVHEMDDDETLNANFTVNYWIQKGAPKQKLILGIPFYGQSFSLSENADNGLGAPSYAGGEGGDETRARGFLSFYEICDRVRTQGWKVYRDPGGRIGPYATLGDQWVSFDDDYMVRHKAEYVRAMGLGGSMVWALDLDDFRGSHCGCGPSPLLRTVNYVLRQADAPPPCMLEEIQSPEYPESSEPEEPPNTSGESDLDDVQVQEKPPAPSTTTTSEAAPPAATEEMEVGGSNLEGQSCSGARFREDATDCSKYYLCINGQYIQLTCPANMFWNKNHCDLPENTGCKVRADLKLASETSPEVFSPTVACYFTNWAFYRKDNGSFGPEQVDPSLCTHIVYSFAHLSTENTLESSIPELDISNDFYGKITEFKLKGVKVIIAAGGIENSEDDRWSNMAASSDNRKIFVKSVLKFLKKWRFDGIQIAWQYPVCKQAPCEAHDDSDKDNFSILLVELAKLLRNHNFELSAIVAANPEVAASAYDAEILAATLDWVSVAANDFYDTTAKKTAYLLPLEQPEVYADNNIQSSLGFWAGVIPPRQLVVSLPAYGRSYTLRSERSDAVGSNIAGPGRPGPYTQIPGFLAYYEICTAIDAEQWEVREQPQGTFAVHGSQWTSYLRPEEVFRISSAVSSAGLRGAALFALDLDDWRGACRCQPWPLLSALRQGLYEPNLPPTLCT